MQTETIFYLIGALFMVAAILYFTWEFLFHLARSVKVVSLILLTLFFYFIGNYMMERGL